MRSDDEITQGAALASVLERPTTITELAVELGSRDDAERAVAVLTRDGLLVVDGERVAASPAALRFERVIA